MTEKNFYALFDKPTPQNLQANQQGRLTLEQQSALEMAAKSQRSTFVLFGVIGLSLFAFTLFIFWKIINDLGVSPERIQNLFVNVGVVAVALGLFVAYLLRNTGISSTFFAGDDIRNGRVESVIGKVVWAGGRYKFISETRKLQYLRFGRTLPPPGDYRFYCLPESGLVLIAEELGLMSASQPKDLLLDALARANHFSMDDLQVNREGSLSGRQEVRLFGYTLLSGGLLLLCGGICFWALLVILSDINILFVLMEVLALIIFIRMIWVFIPLLGDMWGGKVGFMDGQVARHIHKARNTRYYTYQVNGLKFYVSQSAYNALIEGREYRVYFAPRSKRLVAIEPK